MKQILLFLVVLLAASSACVSQEVGVERLPIELEPAFQEGFDKIVGALTNSLDPPQDNIEARREIKKLKDSVTDKGDIVRQLVAYAAADPNNEEQPLIALMILHLLDLPPKIVIPELAPYLNDDDIKVSAFVGDWFRGHDNVDPSKDYRDYIGKTEENVPPAFAQYLFEKSPNEAFLVFVGAKPISRLVEAMEALRKEMDQNQPGWDDKIPPTRVVDRRGELPQARDGVGLDVGVEKNELLLAEHLISNAIWLRKYDFHERFPNAMREAEQQLSELSEHAQWWVRLYVAETMRQNPELRQVDVLEKLSRDRNELVSESAKSAIK